MNPEHLTDLKERLIAAELALIEKINAKAPADSVPSHIAIPKLEQLEKEQLLLESHFRRVRDWLDTLAQ